MDSDVKQKLLTFLEAGKTDEAIQFIKLLKVEGKPRTQAQNSSLHLWLTMVASELDRNGFTLQNVIAAIKKAEIRPTMDNLKECLWRPYQIAALGKKSTTQLEKLEVDVVYEGLNKFLGEHFDGMHIPWPSEENKGNDRLEAMKLREKINYPSN
jgi:hypothetical protein